MGDGWSESDAFGELRSLLGGRPNASAFGRICDLIDDAEENAPGLYAERWRDYLVSHLGSWPASTCTLTLPRDTEGVYHINMWDSVKNGCVADAQGPWSEFVRGVTLRSVDLTEAEGSEWFASEMRGLFPELEHLGFDYIYLRKKEVARVCEGGAFDGVSSLAISEADLRLTTLDVLMEHLERVGTLRSLALEFCNLGPRQIARVCESSLVPRLEVLNLSGNGSLKREGFAHLIDAAPRFTSLRELRLDMVNVPVKSVVALAEAGWPALERMSFHRSEIKGTGIKGIIQAERLGALMEDVGGVSTLDLTYQGLKDRGSATLARCAQLAVVESLSLADNTITDLAPLASSPHIDGVKVWDLGSNELDASQAEHVLEIVRRTKPRALSLNGMMLGDRFLEDLFAMEEASALEVLRIMGEPGYGDAGLEALLGWARLPELTTLQCVFRVGRETELVARALGTGHFMTTRDNHYSGKSTVVAKGFDV